MTRLRQVASVPPKEDGSFFDAHEHVPLKDNGNCAAIILPSVVSSRQHENRIHLIVYHIFEAAGH